jgi:adenosylcobinamide-GDP ribazoletransferase
MPPRARRSRANDEDGGLLSSAGATAAAARSTTPRRSRSRPSRRSKQSNTDEDDAADLGLLPSPPPAAAAPDRAVKNVLPAGTVAARGSGTAQRDFDPYERMTFLDGEYRILFTSLMFLTRLPVPSGIDHHAAMLMRAVSHFPLIGVIVGVFGATWYAFASMLWSPPIAAVAACLAFVWVSGCFHEDGLCDSLDGIGGGWSKEQILQIMQDSRVGTYALVGVSLILTGKVHAIALLAERAAAAELSLLDQTASVCRALVAAQCASRWTCVVLTRACVYVTDPNDAKAGIYNWFAESGRLLTNARVAVATVVAVGVPAFLYGGILAREALMIDCVVAVATVISGFYGNMMIGGVIGDYLGATVIVTELAILLALGADWGRAASVGAAVVAAAKAAVGA